MFKGLWNRENVWFGFDILACIGWAAFWCIIGYDCICDGWYLSITDALDLLIFVAMIVGPIMALTKVGFHLYKRGVRFKHPNIRRV